MRTAAMSGVLKPLQDPELVVEALGNRALRSVRVRDFGDKREPIAQADRAVNRQVAPLIQAVAHLIWPDLERHLPGSTAGSCLP